METYCIQLDQREYNEYNFCQYDETSFNKLSDLVDKYNDPETIQHLGISEADIKTLNKYEAELNEFLNERTHYYYLETGRFPEDFEAMESYHMLLYSGTISEDAYFEFSSLVDKYLEPDVLKHLNISEEELSTLKKYKLEIESYDIESHVKEMNKPF